MQTHVNMYISQSMEWVEPLATHLDSPDTLVLLFGPFHRRHYYREAVMGICDAFPQSVKMGCTTAGEIFDARHYEGEMVLAVAKFDRTVLYRYDVPIRYPAESKVAGEILAAKLLQGGSPDELRGVLVLSDGLKVNGSKLAEGLSQYWPKGVEVAGGMAGDYEFFEMTALLTEERTTGCNVREGFVSGVALFGKNTVFHVEKESGFRSTGRTYRITNSEQNVLFTLDNRPALDVYREILGTQNVTPEMLLTKPLLVQSGYKEYHLRTIIAVNEATKSITFAGDIPRGREAIVMGSNEEDIISAAEAAAEAMGEALAGCEGDTLCVAIDCVGRRLVLGDMASSEIAVTERALPPGCKLTGFYSYGELSAGEYSACSLYNQTMTLIGIGEE